MNVNPEDVHWVVNSYGELGVEIGGRYFFLQGGESYEYDRDDPKDGLAPLMARRVGVDEFGKTQWPLSWLRKGRREEVYAVEADTVPVLYSKDDPEYKWRPIT